MANNVRIDLWNGTSWATTVYFNKEEVDECELEPVNDVVPLQNLEHYPQMFDMSKISVAAGGREGWHLSLVIIHHYGTTRAKVEQIIDCTYKVRVYYNYIDVPATYKDFVVDPNYSEFFVWGQEEARVSTSLEFFGGAN